MVQYTFKWQKRTENEEVYVTGTFDNWSKSVKLEQDEKDPKVLSGTTDLQTTEKIYYKFVVNNDWIADTTAATENDDSGIQNNVLYPEQIIAASTAEMSVPEGKVLPLTDETTERETITTLPHTQAAPPTGDVFIQSTAPQATTVQLAAAVPLEKNTQALPLTEETETVTTLPHTEAAPTSDVFVQSAAPQATTVGLAAAVPIESGALAVEEAQIKKAQYDAEHPQPQPTVVDKAKEFAAKIPESQIVHNAQEFVTHTIPAAANVAYTGIAQKVDSTIQAAVESSQKKEGQGVLAQANEFISNVVPKLPENATQTLSHMMGLDRELDSTSPTPDVSGGPGGFPATPAFERRESEQMGFKVTPLPASKGPDNPVTLAPGEEVPSVGTASVTDNVKLDEQSYKAADSSNFGVGDNQTFGINPLPASKTAENPITLSPGDEVPRFQAESVDYAAKLDEDSYKAADSSNFGVGDNQTFSVNPFPASETAENPVTLKAGEPIPEHLRPGQVGTQSINSQVRLDEESYNKPDSANLGVGVAAFTLPDVVTPAEERAKRGGSIIPGVEAYFRSSKTDAEVPTPVQESIRQSDWAPEAAANRDAVDHKKDVESELLKAVKDHEKPAAAKGVPSVVAQSLAEFNASPEAAANPIAVEEKKDVESELLKKVNSHESASKPAAAVPDVVQESIAKSGQSAEAAASPEAVKAKEQVESALVAEIPKKTGESDFAATVPEVVKDSLARAHASPEAAAATPAVERKEAVEGELLKSIDSHKEGLKHVETKESSTLPSAEHTGSVPAATGTHTSPLTTTTNNGLATSNGHSNGAAKDSANGHSNGNGSSPKSANAPSPTSSRSPRNSTSPRRSGDEGAKSDSDRKKEKRGSRWFHKLTHAFKSGH